MPKDNRLDFDSMGDLNGAQQDLLRDVMQATEQAKQQKAKDKAQDAQAVQKTQDRRIMYAVVAVAAAILLVVAYFVTFRGAETPTSTSAPIGGSHVTIPAPGGSRPMLGPGVPSVGPSAHSGTSSPQPASRRPQPTSDPVRRNGSDTYDEGSGPGNSPM